MHFSKAASDVIAFHNKFDLKPLSMGGKPEFKLRYDRLVEELDEIQEALDENDKGKFLDALVDTVYIAVGTLYLYDEVHWFTNDFDYPVQPGIEPCSFMNRFNAKELRAYFTNDEATHCKHLASLVNHIFVWCANNNWPFDEAWDEVQKANMAKERAKPDASDSKHKSGQDIVKPEGWTAPDIHKVVEWHQTKGGQMEMDV
uniref:Nucleotide pyrophosphohydrolase n=2 Tax=unclassified Rosemountvirus TaxID=2738372 RepID=A0AAU8GH05_9CAUD